MKKDKKILTQNASEYLINKSTIANGLKVLYLQASSSILQLMWTDNRIRSALRAFGVTTKENPELGALKEYYTAIKRAQYYFDEFIGKSITDATWGAYEGKNKAVCFDCWQADANMLARMTLMLYDRVYHDDVQEKKIIEFLEGLEGHGQFNEDDFKYFEMDYPKECSD